MHIKINSHNLLKRVLPALFLMLSCCLMAQSRFEIAARGGTNMLLYKSDYGTMLPSYNVGLDLLYSYRSPYVVGFRGGVAVDLSQSSFLMQNFHDQYTVWDYATLSTPSNQLDVNYRYATVKESHNQLYVSVPLQLAFHFGNFGVFVGPKVALPLSTTFKQELTAGAAAVEYVGQPGIYVNGYEHVFNSTKEPANLVRYEGEITGVKGMKKYDVNLFASLDVNYYIPVSKTSSIGIGVYVDYGIPLYGTNNATVRPETADAAWKKSLMWIDDPTKAPSLDGFLGGLGGGTLTPDQLLNAAGAAGVQSAPMKHSHNSVLNALMVNGKSDDMQIISHLSYLSCGVRVSYNIGEKYKTAPKHWYKDLKKCNCVFTN